MNLYTNVLCRHLKSKIKESIVAYQRRMEAKDISNLLLVETHLTLSKAMQYLIINIHRERSFKCFFYRQHICPVWWTSDSTSDYYSNGYELCSVTCWFVSTRLWGRLQ